MSALSFHRRQSSSEVVVARSAREDRAVAP